MNIQAYHFKTAQPIHNVPFHHNALLYVVKGEKHVFTPTEKTVIKAGELLIVMKGQCLNFTNQLDQHDYFAWQINFDGDLPENIQTLLQQSKRIKPTPSLVLSAPQKQLLCSVIDAHHAQISNTALEYLSYALLADLSEYHNLSGFLVNQSEALKHKLLAHFSASPSETWRLQDVAAQWFMSPATLKRRLSEEGASFRQVLLEARLSHALGLMIQSPSSLSWIAQQCGYQSLSRFSQQFKLRFGLSVKQFNASCVHAHV
jgi:AraC-like DNA-binding protein